MAEKNGNYGTVTRVEINELFLQIIKKKETYGKFLVPNLKLIVFVCGLNFERLKRKEISVYRYRMYNFVVDIKFVTSNMRMRD